MATLTSCPGISFPKVGNYDFVKLYIYILARSQAVSALPGTPLVAEGGEVKSKMRMGSMHVFRSSRCMCRTLFSMKRIDLSDFGFRLREKRQRVEHNISCHSQEVSVAMTASTSLSAGPSSPTLTVASSPRIFRSAARMRGDIGAYQMSELSHLVRTLRFPSDLGGLHIRARNNQLNVLLKRYACTCVHLEREASGLHNSWNYCFVLRNRSKNDLRRPKIQIFPRGITALVRALCAHLFAAGNPPCEFLPIYAPDIGIYIYI